MKKAAFLLPVMRGGGAERVAALLANSFYQKNIDVRFLLTHAHSSDVIRSDLSQDIPLITFPDSMGAQTAADRIASKALHIVSSSLCKPFELLKKPVPAGFARLSLLSEYRREIRFLRDMMKAEPELTVIAFLQPAIPIALLAGKKLENRIIISERGDSARLMKKRYGRKFIEAYYPRADAAVFQTEDAKSIYPHSIADKGVVIPNPIKDDLPPPYHGARDKTVTAFCRISAQKNLPLLIDAFRLLYRDHPEYRLRIIGDAVNAEGAEVLRTLREKIRDHGLENAVVFEPFAVDVHQRIIRDAMYVNSSDYEGISNAMLEAMAIGMPAVCTDCPVGGARATIRDGENGLLVPVRDAGALYRAMKRIIEEPELADRLSENAAAVRSGLSLDKTAQRWIALLPS